MFLLKSSLGLDHQATNHSGKDQGPQKVHGHHIQEPNAGDAQELRVQRHDVQHVRHARHQGRPGRRCGADDQQIPGRVGGVKNHGVLPWVVIGDTLSSHIELGPCDMGNHQFCSQKGWMILSPGKITSKCHQNHPVLRYASCTPQKISK